MFTKLEQEWIAKIRQHAQAHYNESGWDFVVECWEDDTIANTFEGATTYKEALALVAEIVGIKNEIRQDVLSEIF